MRRFLYILIVLMISLSVFSQADLPFEYGGPWGSFSMSGGNLTSNNDENYSSNSEHRMDETGHYVQLHFNTISDGIFSVKLIAKVGMGSWSGTVNLEESPDATIWSNLTTITSIGNNGTSVTPSVNLSSGTKYVRVFFSNKISGSNLGVDDFSVSGSPLPVTFSAIKVTSKSNRPFISFSTASETNNSHFDVERSADGRKFDVIGTIRGAGDSRDERRYEFVDERPIQGINYYRIKQTDYDGKYAYTETKSVRHIDKGSVVVSPRNTDGRLDISTDIDQYEVSVWNASGQRVSSFNALSGSQSIDISTLQSGVYFVKVTGLSNNETVRIVKY